jgi:hypothetical protein
MKLEVTIPTSLSDITLGQYQKFLRVKETSDEEFMRSKMIEIFCGVPLKDVILMRYSDVNTICDNISRLFLQQPPLTMRWKHEDVEYGFIPNLEDISLGEYTDIDNYLGDWNDLNRAMAVLYRPVTNSFKKFYAIEQYESSVKYAQVMEQMPLNVALGAMLFIFRLGTELCKGTLNSLAQKVKAMTLTPSALKEGSLNDGDGTLSSTHLQTAISSSLMRLLALMYTMPSPLPLSNPSEPK